MSGGVGVRMRDESGSVTLWLLGLSLLLLAIGGLSVDLWSAFAARRALAGIAEATATAGASGIDVAWYRSTGEVRLAPERARRLAAATFAAQQDRGSVDGPPLVEVEPTAVVVRVEGEVPLSLLHLLAPGQGPLRIAVRAIAEPRLSP